jgi:hypothetical protein
MRDLNCFGFTQDFVQDLRPELRPGLLSVAPFEAGVLCTASCYDIHEKAPSLSYRARKGWGTRAAHVEIAETVGPSATLASLRFRSQ